MQAVDPQMLRQLVRETIREALASSPAWGQIETVSIENDADLHAFVRRILAMLGDPSTAAALHGSDIPFRLRRAGSTSTFVEAPSMTAKNDGVMGERAINNLPKGSDLVLTPGTVLTPMARDRARERGIKLVWRR